MATFTFRDAHPEGTFPAKIISLTEGNGAYGPSLDVGLRTAHGDITRPVSARYTPKSMLTSLVQAALGTVPRQFTTDDLLGRDIRAVIRHIEKEGIEYARVEQFLPLQEDPFINA